MNITKGEKSYLKAQIPGLKKLLLEKESEEFQKMAICIFNGWIKDKDEYDSIFHWKDNDELTERRQMFEKLIEQLYLKTSVYTWKFRRHNKLFINKPSRYEILKSKCDFNNLTEDRGGTYSIILPEFSAVYEVYYDWTNALWFKDINRVKPLLELAEDCGLFYMEWN